MKKERLKVLDLLDEGKITTEDALKLLEAIGANRLENEIDYTEDLEKHARAFQQSVESFAKEFGSKVSGAYKDMEPRIKGATRTVVEKTAFLVDDISKSLHESLQNLKDQEECCKDEPCCCEGSQEGCVEKSEEPCDEPREN